MCKAIKEMLRVSRQEGEQEGRQEGRQKGRLEGQDGMATLSEKLILADRVSKLLKASTDRDNLKRGTVIHLVFCDLSCYYKSVSIF